jgi:hypothetical protein
MPKQAPRIDSRLIAALARVDDDTEPIAVTYRRIGRVAERLGIVRPSYEQVRVLVHSQRRRAVERKAELELMADVLLGRRAPMALSERRD